MKTVDPTPEEIWGVGGLAEKERLARTEPHRRDYNSYHFDNRGEPLYRLPQHLKHMDIVRGH